MELNFNMENKQSTSQRMAKAKDKKKKAQYEPTWTEVWQNIASRKNSKADIEKLKMVKEAIDNGELGTGVESLKKFSKAHALRLYKELIESRKEQYIEDTVANIPENYHCITDGTEFNHMLNLLGQEVEIGLDTETTGVKHEDNIVGLSMTLPRADYHCYIPVRHVGEDGYLLDGQLEADMVFKALQPYMEDDMLGKVLHNASFDSHKLYKEGIDLQGITMDTMIAMHVLNENEPTYALKALATKYGKHFGFEDKSWDYSTLFGKNGFETVPLDIGTYYACKDTHLTIAFAEWIRGFYKEQPELGEAYRLENRILEISIDMERHGVVLDTDFAREYADRLLVQLDELEHEIKEELEVDNINSTQQLLQSLTDKGILPKDAGSVDKNTLKKHKRGNPVVQKILQYRKLSKLHGTYISPLPEKMRDTGRLHCSFNQHTTVTGRFSSNNPNFQNIPEDARAIFIPDKDCIFVGIDFSQIEPRYMAHKSGDKEFQHPYLNGIDLYSVLASKTFNVPIEECGDGTKYRKDMKMGLLANMYGISPYQLGEQIGLTTEEAEQFLQDFLDAFPTTARWMESVHNEVVEQGYVRLLGGRKRRFPEIQKVGGAFKKMNAHYKKLLGVNEIGNIWETSLSYKDKRKYWDVAGKYYRVMRQSVNAVIQGSSATIMKMAMIDLYDYIKDNNLPYKMLMTIHDEVIIEIPSDTTREEIEALQDKMNNCISLDVPLKTDAEIMRDNWSEKISMDEHFSGGAF